MFGLQGYNQVLTAREQKKLQDAKLEEEAQQREMRRLQIEQAKAAQAEQARMREIQQRQADLAARAFAPGVAPATPVDDEGNPMPLVRGGVP
jgi:cell division protein FtsL